MKKWYLLIILAFASCKKNNNDSNPLVLSAMLDSRYSLELIIGSDTQKVDSLYDDYFNKTIRYTSYYHNDTLRAEAIISKHYLSNNLMSIINEYINNHRNSNISCDNTFMITTNCILFTYDQDNNLVKTCMLRKDLPTFLEGLLNDLKKQPYNNEENYKLLVEDLNALCYSKIFPHTMQQLKKERSSLRKRN